MMLAFQEIAASTSNWEGRIFLIFAVLVLLWLIRIRTRSATQYSEYTNHALRSIEVAEECQESNKQLLAVQQETNRLLMELNETLKNRPL